MKLTNNKLEKLIMEVLTESTKLNYSDVKEVKVEMLEGPLFEAGEDYEFKIKGGEFKVDKVLTKKYQRNRNVQNPTESKGTTLIDFYKKYKQYFHGVNSKTGELSKGVKEQVFKMLDANKDEIPHTNNQDLINQLLVTGPPVPKTFDLPTFNNLLDAVMTAAKGTDQSAVDTAKSTLNAYYQQYKQGASAAMTADATLKDKYDTAVAAKAKFNFAVLKKHIDNLNGSTDLTTLLANQKTLEDYYNANSSEIDKDQAQKDEYNAAISDAAAKKTQFQNDAFKKIIDNAVAIANNTGSSESTLRNTKASLDNKKTNDANFAAYVANNQGEYDSAITALDDAIDLIVNKWKSPDEAIGIETPADIDPSSTKSYTDPDRNKILKALQTSFGRLIPKADLVRIAQITEGKERFLTEDTNTLELADIEAYIDDLLSKDPKTLNATQKAQHATDLALADKIDQALKDYINQVRDPARATKLKKAKRDYDALLVKQRGLQRAKYTKYAASDRLPTATTIGGTKQKSPVDPIVVDSFMTFFKDHHTIKEKIKFLSEFSDAVAKAADGDATDLNNSTKFPAEKVIVGGNILNMMSKATRQFDSSAGGLVIEALLAFMVSGEKIGQAGGAADFKDSNGKLYSSKWGQKSKTQSISNFSNIGEVITYVSAYKYQTGDVPLGKPPAGGGKGKPLLSETIYIHEVDVAIYDILTVVPNDTIYKGKVGAYASVKLKTGKSSFTKTQVSNLKGIKAALGSQTDKNGNRTHFDVSTDKMVDANGESFLTKYKIKFVGAETQIFDDIFSEAVEKQTSDLVKAVTRLNSLSKSLEEQATSYTVTGDFSDAVSLANSHKDIRKQIETIYLEKEGPSSGAKITDIGLTESKLQTLDQLIAETMREIKRKRKK